MPRDQRRVSGRPGEQVDDQWDPTATHKIRQRLNAGYWDRGAQRIRWTTNAFSLYLARVCNKTCKTENSFGGVSGGVQRNEFLSLFPDVDCLKD
jgi:hypothetical protein